MNKNTLPIIIITLLLLLVGGGYFVYSKLMVKNTGTTTQNKATTQEESGESSVTGSFLDLIKMGKTVKCGFSYKQDNLDTSGITYVSGKKMKGEFTSTVDGKEIKSNMVSDGDYFYMWSDAIPQGYKMKVSEAEADSENIKSQQLEAMKNIQGNYDYKCSPWIASDSTFEVPTNITFTDFSQIMNPTSGTTNQMCATCNMIQDDEGKAQCKAQFKCE